MIEVLGIIASVSVAASFFMNGEKLIRQVNLIGSVLFVIYGLLIGSISVAFLNTVSIAVNTIKIYRMNKEEISNENHDNSHQ